MENKILEFNYLQTRSLSALFLYEETFDLTHYDRMEIGYNPNSGYVYIAYQEGLTLAIFEGRDKMFDVIVYGYDDDGEVEYDSVEEWKEAQLA